MNQKEADSDQVVFCLEIEEGLLARKIGFGNSIEQGRIPWQISPDPFKFTTEQVVKIEEIGRLVYLFLQAAVDLYQTRPQVRSLLDRGKPAEVLAVQALASSGSLLPRLFRADLLLLPDGRLKVGELSLKPGGTGITASLQEVYPGKMVGQGILNCYKILFAEGNGQGVFVVPREKLRTLTEFQGLATMMQRDGYHCQASFPDRSLVVPEDGFVYSYLPPRTWGKYRQFIEQAWHSSRVFTPPPHVFLKEKALFALLHDWGLVNFWRKKLGRAVYLALRNTIVDTVLLDCRSRYQLAGLEISPNELKGLTAAKRAKFLVKLSGFSEGASGARGVVFGSEVGTKAWGEGITRAQCAFQQGQALYVLQPFVDSKKVPVSWLDYNSGAIRKEDRYLRLLAYYFVLRGQVVLAGVEVNSGKRPKVHLQENTTSVPGVVVSSKTD